VKIHTKDVPNDTTVWNYILKNSNTAEAWEDISQSYNMPDIFRMKHNWNCDELSKDIEEAKQIYGDHGWVYKNQTEDLKSPYTGFSLVYNPNHIDNLPEHQGTFGTPNLDSGKFTTHNYKPVQTKNSYWDSHGMIKRTKASKFKSIGRLLDCGKRTLMRSRVATCHGNTESMLEQNRNYHSDAPNHFAIRINIPIKTSVTYFFKMENRSEPMFLDTGWAYTFNNKIPHKVYTARPSSNARTHLVLAFSPWWDYNIEEDTWTTNKFFGKKHPMQMVMDGDVLSGLSNLDVDI
jgi:hypothetical protein